MPLVHLTESFFFFSLSKTKGTGPGTCLAEKLSSSYFVEISSTENQHYVYSSEAMIFAVMSAIFAIA